jgi:membrane-bound transcription factor site-1 protease
MTTKDNTQRQRQHNKHGDKQSSTSSSGSSSSSIIRSHHRIINPWVILTIVMAAIVMVLIIPLGSTNDMTTTSIPSRTLLSSSDDTQSNPSPTEPSSESPPVVIDDRYIVSFHEYRARDEHTRTLTTLLQQQSSSSQPNEEWHIVDRHNPASALPTDFLLVSFKDPSSDHTKELLNSLRAATDRIRYVVPDRPMKLTPLSSNDGANDINERFTMPRGGTSSLSSDDVEISDAEDTNMNGSGGNRRLHGFFGDDSVTSVQGADWIWKQGYSGKGVRVAIFDTGLAATHPHFKNIRERTNWTGDKTLDDTQGHGTSVAGIIGTFSCCPSCRVSTLILLLLLVIIASHTDCQGFAPDADLHIFRVFDSKVTSYTAWFLDAFNYAIHTRVHILNLSIGGPDWADKPFVDKVHELAANGVIVVSAIGNVETGKPPLWGSLNNPADQLDVIGVGGIDFNNQLARFSARGMTTWELPNGYGRIKPDIVAQGANVRASGRNGGCKSQSGTSFASPVAAGVATLLSSIVSEENGERARKVNPASMKQVITESAIRVGGDQHATNNGGNGVGIYEQGMGRLNLRGAYDLLSVYTPRASVLPPSLDFTDCPYMWPFCTQPLYHTSQPLVMNMTILNGMSVSGYLREPPVWYPDNKASEDAISMDFQYPKALWPWSGHLGVFISVVNPVQQSFVASGFVSLTVISDDDSQTSSTVNFSVKIACQPAPPRHKRILWDQFHNLNYPSGYFPRDDIHVLTGIYHIL